jgi:hypothetical protein
VPGANRCRWHSATIASCHLPSRLTSRPLFRPDRAALLELAREYTERWLHQQHIRDAVGAPGQTDPRFLAPVLATFAHAFPVALRRVTAAASAGGS